MLNNINDTMFRPEEMSPRTVLLSDEEDTSEEEEEEEEEEEHGPEVKALIDNIAAIVHDNELRANRYTRINETANVVAYLQEHTGWLAHLSPMDQYNFVKNILKRRRLERRVRREGEYDDEWLMSRGLRTRDEARRFLDADKGWMVKIMHSWSYTVPHFDQTRERIGSAPWHGENPAECNMTGLSVCCKLTKYHKGPYPGPNYYPGPTYPLWWRSGNPRKPIDELMHEGRVFSDGGHQVWVQLTETEFKDSFSGKHKGEAIDEYMEKDLLKRVHPGTPPHMSGMMPFREYRPCTVTREDPDPDAGLAEEFYTEGADDGMSEGGNRAQKKHKTKSKTKTKSKCKCKTKSKSKSKSKTKSQTKTKSKTRNH